MPIDVYKFWLAPKPNPVTIEINKYIKSSGSLIGVLNLTIDKAPTKPSESAKDDLTTVIITQTIKVRGTIEDIICLPP